MSSIIRRLRFREPIGRASSIISRKGATPSSIKSTHSELHRIRISSQLSGSICSQSYASYSARSCVRYFGNQPWRLHNRNNNNWGSNNPLFGGKNVLYAIMGLNIATTGAWYLAQKDFYYRKFMSENFLASANGVLGHFRVHTLVTAIFFNHDFSQLVTNLFSIYLSFTIGGGARFAAMYLAGGLLSTTSQVVIPRREFESVSGASCAAATVFIYKVLQDPRMTVLLFGMLPANLATIGATLLAVECVATFTGRGYNDQSRFGGAALGFLVHMTER